MDWARQHPIQSAAIVAFVLGFLYLLKLNGALKETPPQVLAACPQRWTEQEMRETYERIKSKPISWAEHLPPKLNRRYIITGGSGGVGGQIILQLLERGQPPESIRNVDFRAPGREDLLRGPGARVDFVKTDITSAPNVHAAFSKPWPDSAARLPLTVFHVAAILVFNERRWATYDRAKRVNVDGTQNVLDASKAAGADVFVYTSSASVALRPVQYWGAPWRRWPRNYVQVLDESDFHNPVRPHGQQWSNYAYSKSVAERLVSDANSSAFRTGMIRPGNGVYGSSNGDQVVGLTLRMGTVPIWTAYVVQNSVHVGHVSLGHLLFEAALLGSEELPPCAGRPYNITDDNPPHLFGDMYRLLETLSATHVKVVFIQPIIIHLVAHAVETLEILSEFPGLSWLKPQGQIAALQPSTLTASTHTVILAEASKKSVKDGGLGFKAVCTTLEGVVQQVIDWNIEHQGQAQGAEDDTLRTISKSVKNLKVIPAAV